MKSSKYIIFIILSFITFSVKAQNVTALIGKFFKVKIGSVCQETSKQDNCAGYEIFLKIKFNKNNIEILRKEINSCRQIVQLPKLYAEWAFEKPDKIIISKMAGYMEEDAVSIIKSLIYKNGKLTGKSAYSKNEIIFNSL